MFGEYLVVVRGWFLSGLHRDLCCGCSLESLGKAILMGAHSMGFCEEKDGIIT